MRIRILCVGRMKDGPERELVDDYLTRAQKSGKSLGYRAVEEIEIPSSTKDDEGTRLLAKHGQGILIRLDERGEAWTSQDLSKRLARWRDAGEDACSFVIGGADGTSPAVAAAARASSARKASCAPALSSRRQARAALSEALAQSLLPQSCL